jgi:hypothetical protein
MSDAQISSGAPGVQSPVAGREDTESSVAGAAPDGGPLDRADQGTAEQDGLNDAGESMADDAVPPEEGLPGDGDSVTGNSDAATGDGPTG